MNSSSFFNKCKIHTNEIQTQIMFDQTRMLLMSFFISQKTEEQILGISKRMFPVSIAEKVFFLDIKMTKCRIVCIVVKKWTMKLIFSYVCVQNV